MERPRARPPRPSSSAPRPWSITSDTSTPSSGSARATSSSPPSRHRNRPPSATAMKLSATVKLTAPKGKQKTECRPRSPGGARDRLDAKGVQAGVGPNRQLAPADLEARVRADFAVPGDSHPQGEAGGKEALEASKRDPRRAPPRGHRHSARGPRGTVPRATGHVDPSAGRRPHGELRDLDARAKVPAAYSHGRKRI